MKFKRAIKVKPIGNYMIVILFDNGEERIYNCYPLLQNKLFSKLTDKDFFNEVHIDEMGLVCWDRGTDIPPDELYNNSVSVTSIAV